MTFLAMFYHFLLCTVFVISVARLGSGNRCTEVLSKSEVKEVVVKQPCITKYTARCGWFSLDYCTFYDHTYCDKRKNETVKSYYIVSHCCKGYYLEKDGSCLKKLPGVVYAEEQLVTQSAPTDDPNYVEQPQQQRKEPQVEKIELPGGAYAGIICGLVLIVCITAFTIIAVRKRKRNKNQKPDNKVLYVAVETGHTANLPSAINKSPSRSTTPKSISPPRATTPKSVSPTREPTPTSSRIVTPPRSPVSKSAGASSEMPPTQIEDTDNIPESDV